MRDWSLKHVSNGVLLRDLETLVAQDCVQLARLLAHLGEVQARKLYREAAQPHMYAYCINVLHFSEDAAGKRIHVAGVARKIPALFQAIAEGRLHLTGACEIAAHLTPENADQLLADVTHQTKEQIRVVIASLAPKADLPERITAIAQVTGPAADVAPGTRLAQVIANIEAPSAPAQMEVAAAVEGRTTGDAQQAAHPPQSPPPARVTPLAPDRFGVQFNIDAETNELLKKAEELLGLRDKRKIETVFKRALTLLVRDLERRKCAATDKPRKAKRPKSPDVISASVRREVWKRDKGQCTFVNEEGRRCPSRGGLEEDHIRPKARAARDGRTTAITASDVRLLCRAHNQLEAERVYGAAFMANKRELAATARTAVTSRWPTSA